MTHKLTSIFLCLKIRIQNTLYFLFFKAIIMWEISLQNCNKQLNEKKIMVFKLLLVIFFQETLFRGPFRSKVTLLSLVQNIFSLVDESFFRQKINDLIINSYLRTIFKLHVNLSIKQVLQQKNFFFLNMNLFLQITHMLRMQFVGFF